MISFDEASADGSKLIIRAQGVDNAGSYYLYDKASRKLEEIGPIRPALEGRILATVRPVTIPAPDGAMIPAYLTLPAGGKSNLPAVVLPHGGPSARDSLGFDWLAQFLAARGYAVVQPNYRGSSGYGESWEGENGFRAWRTAIGDVTASARWLISQGIANPQRLAIVGWSYGGYAALQSVAVEPTLYKAAVAIAPVTDLALLKTRPKVSAIMNWFGVSLVTVHTSPKVRHFVMRGISRCQSSLLTPTWISTSASRKATRWLRPCATLAARSNIFVTRVSITNSTTATSASNC
jgi:dipeptidyl aminopeptidase/acylaminoacyl peptidase